MHLVQNIHAGTSAYTAPTHPLTHIHTHTAYTPSPRVLCPAPLWCSCSKLSWALMAGSRWHRQPTLIFYWTLFVLFILLNRCTTAARGLTHSSQLKPSNIPSCRERVTTRGVPFIFLLNFMNTWKQPVMFSPSSLSTGILKFHEVYLGEGVSEGGSDFQEGSGGGVVSGSSLEQHIASAREALGVESYYSRWDVYSCHSEMNIFQSVW